MSAFAPCHIAHLLFAGLLQSSFRLTEIGFGGWRSLRGLLVGSGC